MKLTMRKQRKGIWGIGVLLILLMMQLFSGTASAAVSDDTPVDFVLVLDCSGSLGDSDGNHLSISAAKMFVDMLPAENSRLAVVAFGDDYGSEAYALEGTLDERSKNRVTIAYPLQSITDLQQKDSAKEMIDIITQPTEEDKVNWTPVGYALEAACNILEEGGTEQDSASIILLSDGRVSGQNDGYNGDYDYESIDMASAKAAESGWPIYCLELNYDQVNGKDAGSSSGRIGYYQMRQIPEKTNAAHIEMTSPTEAQNAFAEIFAKFFDAEPTIASGTIQDGEVSLDFSIGEMIAETNLTITQKFAAGSSEVESVSEVEKIVIRDPEGKEITYENNNKTISDANRVITFGDKYITAKLMTPKSGGWTITAYGTDDVEIGLYAVSIREMNLQLNALTERVSGNEGTLPKGTSVDFSASYIYNGGTYSSDTFYRESKAYLLVEETGERVEMTGGDDNYKGTLTFRDSGTYTVKAYVESTLFRNDRKESGSYTFQVGNIPLVANGSIDDVEMKVGGSSQIDCAQYFKNEDGDKVTYKIQVDQTADLQSQISENGILTIKAGRAAGEYAFTVSANDGNMDTDVEQTFTVRVENSPLTMIGSATEILDFSYNAETLPGFVLRLCKVVEQNEAEILWEEYFNDPDGFPVDITVKALQDSDAIQMEYDSEKMQVSASEKGKAVYEVTAVDCSDNSVVCTMTVNVNSLDAVNMVWLQIRTMVFFVIGAVVLLIVILIAAFGGRKIYGIWDVTCGSYYEEGRKLGSTRSGKKAKCRLDDLLEDLDMPDGFRGVVLAAGNNLTKNVIVKGLEKVDTVIYNDNELTRKVSRLTVKKGQSVTLENEGVSVTLERH